MTYLRSGCDCTEVCGVADDGFIAEEIVEMPCVNFFIGAVPCCR
jgi:hypothetical protein